MSWDIDPIPKDAICFTDSSSLYAKLGVIAEDVMKERRRIADIIYALGYDDKSKKIVRVPKECEFDYPKKKITGEINCIIFILRNWDGLGYKGLDYAKSFKYKIFRLEKDFQTYCKVEYFVGDVCVNGNGLFDTLKIYGGKVSTLLREVIELKKKQDEEEQKITDETGVKKEEALSLDEKKKRALERATKLDNARFKVVGFRAVIEILQDLLSGQRRYNATEIENWTKKWV